MVVYVKKKKSYHISYHIIYHNLYHCSRFKNSLQVCVIYRVSGIDKWKKTRPNQHVSYIVIDFVLNYHVHFISYTWYTFFINGKLFYLPFLRNSFVDKTLWFENIRNNASFFWKSSSQNSSNWLRFPVKKTKKVS